MINKVLDEVEDEEMVDEEEVDEDIIIMIRRCSGWVCGLKRSGYSGPH